MTVLRSVALAVPVAVFVAGPALAQPYYGYPYGPYAPPPPPLYYGGPYDAVPYGYYRPPRRAFPNDPNNTGGAYNVVIPRGGLGADTYQTDSAVAGNQSRPELSVPNGSGGGGSR